MTDTQPKRPGRNDRCHCGSGKKYKQCCLAKDAAADRAAREEAAPKQVEPPEAGQESESTRRQTPRPRGGAQPWKRDHTQALGFQKRSGPRNRGGSS